MSEGRASVLSSSYAWTYLSNVDRVTWNLGGKHLLILALIDRLPSANGNSSSFPPAVINPSEQQSAGWKDVQQRVDLHARKPG